MAAQKQARTADAYASPEIPLPHDMEAEEALIGSVLIDPEIMREISWLSPRHFYRDAHRAMWECVIDLYQRGKVVDYLTLKDEFEVRFPSLGDYSDAMLRMANSVPTSLNAAYYATIIMEKAQARGCIELASQLADAGWKGRVSEDVVYAIQRKLTRLVSAHPGHTTKRMTYSEVLDASLEETYGRMEGHRKPLFTGFSAIDRHTGGYEAGNLIYIAGRPGSGKSGLALSLGRRIAGHCKHVGKGTVCYVTMEMSAREQAQRLITEYSRQTLNTIDPRSIRKGFRVGDEVDLQAWNVYVKATEEEKKDVGDHLVFYQNIVTSEQLSMLALEEHEHYGMQVLIIDQMDLIADSSRESERIRISAISRNLKQLAIRLGIIVICLVQLNRNTETRVDKHPQLTDLKESGQLEQDADIVYGMYRPAYYYDWEEDMHIEYREWAELTVMKYRGGESNVVHPLRFIPQSAQFTDWYDTLEIHPGVMMEEAAKRAKKG